MELFTAIKDTFISHLHTVPWMDGETRAEAQDKVRPGERDSVGLCRGCQWGVGSGKHGDWGSVLEASVTTNVPHGHPGGTPRGGDRAANRRMSLW